LVVFDALLFFLTERSVAQAREAHGLDTATVEPAAMALSKAAL
jgi:hypothetical protein